MWRASQTTRTWCYSSVAALFSGLLVIIWLYLHLIYVISAFSFSLVYHDFNNRLQLTAHNYINISYISLLTPSHQPYFRLNYFKIHVMDNKFKKIN
jgi:hypothetical protein